MLLAFVPSASTHVGRSHAAYIIPIRVYIYICIGAHTQLYDIPAACRAPLILDASLRLSLSLSLELFAYKRASQRMCDEQQRDT